MHNYQFLFLFIALLFHGVAQFGQCVNDDISRRLVELRQRADHRDRVAAVEQVREVSDANRLENRPDSVDKLPSLLGRQPGNPLVERALGKPARLVARVHLDKSGTLDLPSVEVVLHELRRARRNDGQRLELPLRQ